MQRVYDLFAEKGQTSNKKHQVVNSTEKMNGWGKIIYDVWENYPQRLSHSGSLPLEDSI